MSNGGVGVPKDSIWPNICVGGRARGGGGSGGKRHAGSQSGESKMNIPPPQQYQQQHQLQDHDLEQHTSYSTTGVTTHHQHYTMTATTTEQPHWSYADEASLYSIAEDSREDYVSEMTPSSGVLPKSVADKLGAGVLPPPTTTPQDNQGVELCYAEDDDHSHGSSAQLYYYYNHTTPLLSRYRYLLATSCCVCLLLMGAIVAVVVTQSTNTAQQVSKSVVDLDDAPTSNAFSDTTYVLAENFVRNALEDCSQDASSLFDSDTPQGTIFQQLVQEVHQNAQFEEDATFALGEDYLRERYALGMFYDSTNGDYWRQHDNWLEGDPCDWFGIECDDGRQPGTCAVTRLELGDNNLTGHLAKEFCCMPCIKHIGIQDNRIAGDVRVCMNEIPGLRSIDFSGNPWGDAPTSPTTTTQAHSIP